MIPLLVISPEDDITMNYKNNNTDKRNKLSEEMPLPTRSFLTLAFKNCPPRTRRSVEENFTSKEGRSSMTGGFAAGGFLKGTLWTRGWVSPNFGSKMGRRSTMGILFATGVRFCSNIWINQSNSLIVCMVKRSVHTVECSLLFCTVTGISLDWFAMWFHKENRRIVQD